MSNDKIKIPQGTLGQIKKQIDLNKDKEEKPEGFSELSGYYATGEMTSGQAAKIKSFYDNFSPSDQEQIEKKKTYGDNMLGAFVKNQLQSKKTKHDNSNHIKQMTSHPSDGSQTGRNVDRLNKPNSLASATPNKIITKDLMTEEIERIKVLMEL